MNFEIGVPCKNISCSSWYSCLVRVSWFMLLAIFLDSSAHILFKLVTRYASWSCFVKYKRMKMFVTITSYSWHFDTIFKEKFKLCFSPFAMNCYKFLLCRRTSTLSRKLWVQYYLIQNQKKFSVLNFYGMNWLNSRDGCKEVLISLNMQRYLWPCIGLLHVSCLLFWW